MKALLAGRSSYLRSEAQRAMQQEAEAFRRLHATLLATIPSEYAAIYGGQLVDHDPDQLALFRRIEARFGGLPVLIRQVLPEAEQTIMVRSPRIEYELEPLVSLTGLTQSQVIASASFDKLRTWFAKQSPSPSRRLLRPEGCWRNRTLRSSQ
jgi:hypothetical protein